MRSSVISTYRQIGDADSVSKKRRVLARDADTYKISHKAVQESLREILFDDDTQNVDLAQIRGKVIIWDDPEYAGG